MIRLWVILGLGLLGGCATTTVKLMPPSPHTASFVNGTEFRLDQAYAWTVGNSGRTITVPTGFVTDYASIPPLLRGFIAQQRTYSRASLIHDFLYWTHACTRDQSDNLMAIAMKETGVRKGQRKRIYMGVHLGGAQAWRANRAERDQGLPRVVPAEFAGFPDSMTWAQARQELVRRNVQDPPFAVDPAVCVLGDSRQVPG